MRTFMFALVAALAAPATPQESAVGPRPNVLLIVSEDNGPELGCYGDRFARTPHLDRLARDGVRFANAFVPYSVCSPSRACYLTGLHPQQNGQVGLATHKFAMFRRWPNLVSLLGEAGYRTGLIGKLHVNPAKAFPFDFRRFNGSNFRKRKVRAFAAAAGEFFRAGDRPFFLSINYPDAHFPLIRQQDGLPREPIGAADVRPLPWVGCDSPRLRQFTANYYNCLARLDAGVGMLLDELRRAGKADDTLVIYIGDHGAQFSRGKTSCYDAGLRIPFVVRWPGHMRRGQVRDELVSSLDILPTVLTATRVSLPARLTGRPLQPLLKGRADVPWREHVFAMGTGSAPALAWLQLAVRSARYKLIVNPEAGGRNLSAQSYLEQRGVHFAAGSTSAEIAAAPEAVRRAYATYLRPPRDELYDLENDPYEFHNLAADAAHAPVLRRLRERLAAFRAEIGDPFIDQRNVRAFVAEQAAARSHPYRREKGFRWSYLSWPKAREPRLQLARAFGHHMVLPRDVSVPVQGRAPAGCQVTVRIGLARATTRSDAKGHWLAKLGPQAATRKPRSLVVAAGGQELRLLDVVVGDVWLCAGQSNMAFPLHRSREGAASLKTTGRADLRLFGMRGRLHPGRRRYAVDLLRSLTPGNYYATDGWQRSTEDVARVFSAVGWFFGERLQRDLGVPVGLIDISVGGSPMEAWIARADLAADAKLSPLLESWLDNPAYPAWTRGRARLNLGKWLADPKGRQPHHPFEPGFLFDAGVAPLLPFPVRGVLWYQGESNATGGDGVDGLPADPAINERKLRALIAGWRAAFVRPDLPFFIAQLPGLDREWPVFREVQRKVARDVGGVELVVTIDLGHPTDVHPRRKRPVGERFARLALARVYGKDIVPSGPTFVSHAIAGGKVRLRFDHAAGLRTIDDGAPVGFAVAGADLRFYPARAEIQGRDVVVSSDEVREPHAVRYAWQNDPVTNLVNGEGLPAGPFRTDDWSVRRKLRIACIGDSITFGSGLRDRRRDAYPAVLERLLGPDYTVRNFGRPGAGIVKRSMRAKTRRAFMFQREHRAASSWGPDVVVCNLGINDIMDWARFGASDFIRDYRELLAAYRGLPKKPTVVIWSPLAPVFAKHRFHGDPRIAAIEKALAQLAREERVRTVDLRAPLAAHGDWFADGIHPDARGVRAIAAALVGVVRDVAR